MVGRITADLLEASKDTPRYIENAIKFLVDNFGVVPTMGERLILLEEVRKAQKIQQHTLTNGTVVSMISIPREAVVNYLELLYGFGRTSNERVRMGFGIPSEGMTRQIRYIHERWPA